MHVDRKNVDRLLGRPSRRSTGYLWRNNIT
jgi:hypothetical protein